MSRHRRPQVTQGGAGPRAAGLLGLVTVAVTAGLAATGHAAEPEPAPGLVAGTPCSPLAEACVDLEAGEAWLIREGAVTRGPVPISSGAEGEETPTGRFRVEWKHVDHISGESGVPMPYSVFFAPGGIAFHAGSIDTESAGCVRVGLVDAKIFYDTLQVGDDVEVY